MILSDSTDSSGWEVDNEFETGSQCVYQEAIVDQKFLPLGTAEPK